MSRRGKVGVGSGGSPQDLQEALDLAKSYTADGSSDGAMKALDLVTQIIRQTGGGEQAVMDALKNARDQHRRVIASQDRPGPEWKLLQPAGSSEELAAKESLLGDAGRDQIILDAAEDGSSVMCKACGALVRRDRKKAHDQMWCSAIPDEEDEG